MVDVYQENLTILSWVWKLTKCIKHLWMFRPPNTNFPKQAYIQKIYVQNTKYKQNPK